jgi:hypothetical protein
MAAISQQKKTESSATVARIMRIPLLLPTTCIICVNRNGKQQPSRTQSSWTDRWKEKKISFTNFFKIYFDNRFSGFPTRKPVCTVRTVRSPLSIHELEILQPDQKNLVIARVKKICVSVVYSKIFVFCLKKKNLRLQKTTKHLWRRYIFPLALSLFYYALCLSGFQHQTLFYLWICCFLPKSLCDDVSNAATLADGMAVAR